MFKIKYENVEIKELCPLVFVPQADCDRKKNSKTKEDRLLPFIEAESVVNDFIREKNIKNVYADCNIDNMVEVRGLEDPFDIMELFKLCKANFKEVELGVYLDGYITVDGDEFINFIELNSEAEFWAKVELF